MNKNMPVSIEKFNYRGDMLDVVTDEKGEHYVVLARLCDPFHLDVKTQAEKVNGFGWSTWGIFPMVAADGKTREQVCLSIRSVAGWLFTINAGKIAPHLREKLARYQRECADVLADHFLGKRGTVDLASLRDSLRADFSAEIAPVHARLAALESQGATVLGNTGPTIGDPTADIYARRPLQEIARTFARAVKNDTPAAIKSLRFKAERDLRAAVDFPMTKGMGWHAFPTARLGELGIHLNRMLTTARGLAQVSIPKPVQLSLVANGNSAKKSG